jgi:phosphate transport system substrate-binding protein
VDRCPYEKFYFLQNSSYFYFFLTISKQLEVIFAADFKNNKNQKKRRNRKMKIQKTLKMLGAALVVSASFQAQAVNGAGATFPAPCYQKWIAEYSKATKKKINYQAVGSGAGLAQIRQKTVDFGASDEPLKAEVLEKDGMIQFPMLMGGIVIVANIPGVKPGEIKFSSSVLADIFLGKIKTWDDGKIAALNEGMSLPGEEITVVHRADGSGTTWNFTNYMSKISKEWADRPGCGKEVSWPAGIGGQGNAGVAQLVKKTKYSIGYVESAYAFENNMTYSQLENAAGKFVLPTKESFQAAASNADWKNAPGLYMVLTNQPGENTWPIMAATYILIYKEQSDAAKAKDILSFFAWAYKNGSPIAEKLKYIPIPNDVAEMVFSLWKGSVKSGGTAVWTE